MSSNERTVEEAIYRGRFAPTPSGPLHLGSLLTALGSFLEARSRGGRWLLRIDDLDRERSSRDAESRILRQLEAHGLHWDEAVRRQSEHVQAYDAALIALESLDAVYRCDCSRARLQHESRVGPDDRIYSGRCRSQGLMGRDTALRVRIGTGALQLDDQALGLLTRSREADVGDFVVRRRDGQIAYQLACTIDEHAMRITQVVRGADLIGSSFRQIHLMDLLGLDRPCYRHLPVLVDGTEIGRAHV
jgi:glutamyl-Q tRNA(Asp) synthetase